MTKSLYHGKQIKSTIYGGKNYERVKKETQLS
nr:MAG TPA: hypothetical protein [Caudoviricetes sp.]